MSSTLQPSPVVQGAYPAREGNDVRILIDGHDAFGRIYELAAHARRSLWITVSFVQLDLRLPGRDETFVELVERLAASGVDVRLLFWWSEYQGIGSYRGDDHELQELATRGCRVRMRWDSVPRGCHHQKSYVIDGEIAFVGGINITREALSSAAHDAEGFHDVFAEIRGPAVEDVERNFVERWNQATVTNERGHAFPSLEEAGALDEEAIAPRPPAGNVRIQILRSVRHSLYRGIRGWTEAKFDLWNGEQAIRCAVLECIGAAREHLYVENQFLMDPDTIDALAAAAARGVEVIAVLPRDPDPNLLLYPEEPMRQTRAALSRLGRHANVGLFGLVHDGETGRPIYVHAKLLVADDEVVLLGSANFWPPSYSRDSELNVLLWDRTIAADLRARLWSEHLLGYEARDLDDWRRLERQARDARAAGRRPPARLVAIDADRYYVFPEGTAAPWQNVRESPS